MSSNYYGSIAGELADEGYVPEPIGQYWVDDEGECSICLETLTDCTCLDNLEPGGQD
jgi:hypothetical protein